MTERIMKNLNAIILISGTIILLSSCIHKRNSKEIQKKTNLEQNKSIFNYSFKSINYSKKIDFFKDNKFIVTENICRVNGDRTTKKYFGSYQKDENNIILTPKELEIAHYKLNSDFKEKSNRFPYKQVNSKINTKYYIIKWNDYEYLLSDQFNSLASYDEKNDFQHFASFFNSGIEPSEGDYYFKRKNKKKNNTKPGLNIDQIPKQWRTYFLNEPISAKIIKTEKRVEKSKYQNEFTFLRIYLNKGANDGIKKGFAFSTKYDDFQIKIDSITPNASSGNFRVIEDDFIKIGTEMRTRWSKIL